MTIDKKTKLYGLLIFVIKFFEISKQINHLFVMLKFKTICLISIIIQTFVYSN